MDRYANIGNKKQYNRIFNDLFIKQNGRCAICSIHQNNISGKLQIDHNHKNNIIRGLLCSSCNIKLGHFNDERSNIGKEIKKAKIQIIILKRMIDYLNNSVTSDGTKLKDKYKNRSKF